MVASALLTVCRFNPTAGSTTDWTYSSIVLGYQSPTAANVVNGALYSYRAESADLTQWEIGAGAYNSATGVFARTSVLFNSSGTTSKINFSTIPQVAVVALAEDLTFTAPRTGAVKRTLPDKASDLVSIIDHGASIVASAAANTTAVLAALAAGGNIYVPPGAYAVDINLLSVTVDYTRLYGAGGGSSVFTTATANGIMINVVAGVTGLIIDGIGLTRSVTATSGGVGIYFSGATSKCVVQHCEIQKQHVGVYLSSAGIGTFYDNYIHDCIFDGVELTNTSTDGRLQWRVENNTFEKNGARDCIVIAAKGPAQVNMGDWINNYSFASVSFSLAFIGLSAASTATITIASPGVVAWTAHGLVAGGLVTFTTTGALPTGLTAGTQYYVKTVTDADHFTVSATSGGSVINTTGSQSGTHTVTTVVPINGVRIHGGFLGECGNSPIYLDTYGSQHKIESVFVELAGTRTTGPSFGTAASAVGSGIEITPNNFDFLISDIVGAGNSQDGLRTSATLMTSITGSRFFNNSLYGIRTADGTKAVLTGNTFSNNTSGNVLVSANASGLIATGNSPGSINNPFPAKGYLVGLTLSNNVSDATNDIDIAVGEAASTETSPALMVLASALTKRIDASWTVGTNQGGLDTGSVAQATYHMWLIKRSDTGVVDVLFSLSASAPTMPANYDRKRRIGSIVRGASAIVAFSQRSDEFLWKVAFYDKNGAINAGGTSAETVALTVPTGIQVDACMSGGFNNASGTNYYILSSLDQTDTAPGGSNFTHFTVASMLYCFSAPRVRTDTSAQVRMRASGASSNAYFQTVGYIDTRGRLD